MNRPVTAAVVALALLVAACGDSDDDDGAPDTTETPTTTATTATTTATTGTAQPDPGEIQFGEPESTGGPLGVPLACRMLAEVVVTQNDAVPDLEPEEAFEITSADEARGLDITSDELEMLQGGGFRLFALAQGINPLDVTAVDRDPDRDEDQDISPVYAYGVGGHVVFVPASGPRPEANGPTALPYSTEVEGTLGVVDTGLDPEFQLDHVRVVDSNLDHDDPLATSPVAGHGTFIASLVRQLPVAPEVVMTRARLAEHRVTDGTMLNGQPVSATAAGWSVHHAIVRLADQLNGELDEEERMATPLSLSFVTELCEEGGPGDALLLDGALRYWRGKGMGPIFAGAGNGSHANQPVEPALAPGSFSDVTAVAAEGWNGRRAVFSNEGDRADEQEIRGPGICVVADRGPSFDGVAAWSGTSFATPLVAAASIVGGPASYDDLGQENGRRVGPQQIHDGCTAEETP